MRATVSAPRSEILVSAASIWEAAIKAALGKLAVDGDLVAEITANGFSELPISARHAQVAGKLPRHRDDPVDRLLVTQASVEGLVLATADERSDAYGVAILR